jgi:hypothetical protein
VLIKGTVGELAVKTVHLTRAIQKAIVHLEQLKVDPDLGNAWDALAILKEAIK